MEPLDDNRMVSLTVPILWLCLFLILMPTLLGIMNYLANPSIDLANRRFFGGYFYKLFALDIEQNLPTWYSTILLNVSGLLCLIIFLVDREVDRAISIWWFLIGITFIVLSADEAAGFHEPIALYLRKYHPDHFKGIFRGGWIFPYLAVILVIFPFLLKQFLLKVPRKIAFFMIASGILFLTGAVGGEMIGGFVWDEKGKRYDFWYQHAVIFEEILEMLGVSLFIVTLSIYLNSKKLSLFIAAQQDPPKSKIPSRVIHSTNHA